MTNGAQSGPVDRRGEITHLLQGMRDGDQGAAGELLSHVYRELRSIAARMMAGEPAGHTLQPTALVHEAWLRLMGGESQQFPDRAYFFAALGCAMRRILVESARRKNRLKRGGDLHRVELEQVELAAPIPDDELLALDEALTRLGQTDPRAAEVVNLCFFVGLTQEQAARELEVSISTVERKWAYARAWLYREIHPGAQEAHRTALPPAP
ncbi:MAG TPA: sigma-70 family RNA polymerase sigma factor [Candidatus Acidoferrum sp.]|nr:sigma-70 family RNA polymerase sigma factor [Candidatus Acidoferrum sp.]